MTNPRSFCHMPCQMPPAPNDVASAVAWLDTAALEVPDVEVPEVSSVAAVAGLDTAALEVPGVEV